MSKVTGKVAQIVGPVIDVAFEAGSDLPKIYDSLEIKRPDGSLLVLEVQSHIGQDTVRTIAMDSSDGLSRGTEVHVTGAPIQMPIVESDCELHLWLQYKLPRHHLQHKLL